MSSAKALLVTADAKIAAANAAIINFQAYVPTGSSTIIATSTASTTASSTATTTNIRLDRPRQIGAAAIQAVKDAKNALSDVVVAIAHSTGLRLGDGNENATSTASTTISTSTATSTQ